MADDKQNFYVENKAIINPIIQVGVSFFLEWIVAHKAKKQALHIAQTICGKCPLTECKLFGKCVPYKEFVKCYEEVLATMKPEDKDN